MAKKLLYPYAEELKHKPIATASRTAEAEPLIIETASGFCPNYELFEERRMTAEQALIFCNMD